MLELAEGNNGDKVAVYAILDKHCKKNTVSALTTAL